jgi:hypothetical protein
MKTNVILAYKENRRDESEFRATCNHLSGVFLRSLLLPLLCDAHRSRQNLKVSI